jgi:DnaJ-domain-containing protein 1
MLFSVVAIATTAERILLLPPFLFGLVVCTASLLVSRPKHPRQKAKVVVTGNDPQAQRSHFACLLEDAPATVLHGQACTWATPLLSPLACAWEDAPQAVLRGQACPWATPLLSPLACAWEDAPQAVLRGQACPWATPLLSPLACIVDRVWQDFYRRYLAQPDIHYWDWRNQPQVKAVRAELSLLLALSEPTGATRAILAQLAAQRFDWPLRSRQEFRQWHECALNRYGQPALASIYRVCYGTDWETIERLTAIADEAILAESTPWWQVLGVSRRATASEVEQAYKGLLKRWHPDLNPHEQATLMTARINVAYEEFKTQLEQVAIARQKVAQTANPVTLLQLIRKGLELLRRV